MNKKCHLCIASFRLSCVLHSPGLVGVEECLCLSNFHNLFCKFRHIFIYQVNGVAGLPLGLASYFVCMYAREIENSHSRMCTCVGACVHVYMGASFSYSLELAKVVVVTVLA